MAKESARRLPNLYPLQTIEEKAMITLLNSQKPDNKENGPKENEFINIRNPGIIPGFFYVFSIILTVSIIRKMEENK